MTASLRRSAYRLFGFGGLWRRIAQGTAWIGAGNAISQLSSLISGVLIARLLGKEIYGKFGLLQTSIAVLALFGSFGMSLTVTRYLSRFRETEPEEAGHVIGSTTLISISMTGALSLFLLFGARWVALSISRDADLTAQLRICAFVMFVLTLLGVQQGTLTGFLCFRGAAMTNILRGVLLIPLTIAGTVYGHLSGALWAIALSATVGLIYGLTFIRKECMRLNIRPQWTVRRRDLLMIRDFALPTVVGGVLVTPVNWLVSALMARSPGGYAELAVLTAGVYFRTAMLFFQGMTGTVLIPVFSSSHKEQRDHVMWSAMRVSVVIGFTGILAASIAPDAMMRIFGSGFAGNGRVVMANVVSGALILAGAPPLYWLIGTGRQWTVLSLNVIWAVIYWLGSAYAVSSGWGALGVATASVLAYSVQSALYGGMVSYFRNKEVLSSNLKTNRSLTHRTGVASNGHRCTENTGERIVSPLLETNAAVQIISDLPPDL